MELSKQKLNLIERLMRVRSQETLALVEEILISAEMESRASESEKAIEKGDVVSLDEFTQKNQAWLKKRVGNNTMKIAILLILFVSLSIPVSLTAQSNFGNSEEEIEKCKQHISLYRELLEHKKYGDALGLWEIADTLCPHAVEDHYPNGREIILGSLENETKKKKKKSLIKKLKILYEDWLIISDSPDETIKLRDLDLERIMK